MADTLCDANSALDAAASEVLKRADAVAEEGRKQLFASRGPPSFIAHLTSVRICGP